MGLSDVVGGQVTTVTIGGTEYRCAPLVMADFAALEEFMRRQITDRANRTIQQGTMPFDLQRAMMLDAQERADRLTFSSTEGQRMMQSMPCFVEIVRMSIQRGGGTAPTAQAIMSSFSIAEMETVAERIMLGGASGKAVGEGGESSETQQPQAPTETAGATASTGNGSPGG